MSKTTMITRAIVSAAVLLAAGAAMAEHEYRGLGPREHAPNEFTMKSGRVPGAKSILADIDEDAILVSSAQAAQDQFGYAVAIDGNTAVVGAFGNDEGAADPDSGHGAVEVFLRTGNSWALQQRILAGDIQDDDQYGWSVAVSGNTMVVGSPFADAQGVDSGAVYVYLRTTGVWAQQQKLTGSAVDGGDRFGWSVAIEGDTIIAGAKSDESGALSNAGAAYVFTRSAGVWTQQGRLLASDAQIDDLLGTSVEISGNTAVIGAPGVDTVVVNNDDSGAAYVFARSAGVWTQQGSRLRSSTPADGSLFGYAVAIDGGTIAVGEYQKNSGTGSVQVFVGSGASWTTQGAALGASDANTSDFFGHSIALTGDFLLIGAYQDELTSPPMDRGVAYMFKRTVTTWNQLDKYFASDAISGDRFGFGVALTGSAALVGAPQNDVGANAEAGSAYVFHRGTATTTSLIANPATMSYGQQVTLTAQVTGGTPTGNVEFRDGASVLATAAVNGSGIASTTLTLNVGVYQVAAFYLGDNDHVPSNSAATTVTVNKANTSAALSLTVGSNPSSYGQSLTFRAAIAVTPPGVGPAIGTVEFRDNGALIATRNLVAGEATFTTATLPNNTGTPHPITATYLGNSNFNGSSAGPLNHVVNRASPTAQLTSSSDPSLLGQQIQLTSTITGGIPICVVDFFADDLGDGNPRFSIGFTPVSGNAATINWTPPAVGSYAITSECGSDVNQFAANASGLTQDVLFAANLVVSKSNGVSSVAEGETTVYTITVTNAGPSDVDGVRVVDDVNTAQFDDSAAETSWTCAVVGSGDCSAANGTGDLALAGTPLTLDLANGDVATIQVTTRVKITGLESGVSNTASVILPGNTGDPVPGNNQATDNDLSGLFADGFEP